MPLPIPQSNQSEEEFIQSCMENDLMISEYSDKQQRFAVCTTQWENSKKEKQFIDSSNKNCLKDIQYNNMENLDKKSLNLDFKFDQQTGRIKGYASVFGNRDRVGDIVQKGAFTKSLQTKKPKLLWHHKIDEPIGMIENIREDDLGLFIEGKLTKGVKRAEEARALLLDGVIDGMSIGYKVIDFSFEGRDRILKELDLYEISLVTFPANEKAIVFDIKSVPPVKNIPIADRDTDWDSTAAISRIREKTNSIEKPSSTYKNAFLWYNSEAAENFGSYKFPFCDVIDGQMKIVPKAIFAAAAALRGARGGVDIPENDKQKVISNINSYYKKMSDEFDDENISSPFDEKSINISDINSLKEIEEFLEKKGLTQKERKALISKVKSIYAEDLHKKHANEMLASNIRIFAKEMLMGC